MREELMEEIKSKIEREECLFRFCLDSTLDILFWKDYKGGYITPQLKDELINNIVDTMKWAGPEDELYSDFDKNKALELVNQIREKINLLKLIRNKWGGLEEVQEDAKTKI